MNNYNSIRLNGVKYSGKDLFMVSTETIHNENAPEWLKDIHRFILEWINDSDEIKAQTSGSTGKPKSICLKKFHMIASARKTIEFFNLKEHHSALLCLSANYIAGKMMVVRAFVGGFNLLLQEPVGNPLAYIDKKVDFAALVPLQVSNSVDDINSGLKVGNIIIGGGAVSGELADKIKNAKSICYETYGMTETVSHVAIRRLGEDFFSAMPNVSFNQDERNCLLIDASDVADCKLITNDIVELISDKVFKWLGRYDNIINTGGVKVVPEEIEKKLSSEIKHDFFISSIPDEKLGEKMVLVISSQVKYNVNSILSAFSVLNKYERPRNICLINNFPYSDNNKIQRTVLRKYLQSSQIIYDVDK